MEGSFKTEAFTAGPLRRHATSLESVFSVNNSMTFSQAERTQASARMDHILRHFETAAASGQTGLQRGPDYNRPALIRLTYEYTLNYESKDLFLGSFFGTLSLPPVGNITDRDVDIGDPRIADDLRPLVYNFGEYLMANFFMPRKILIFTALSFPKLILKISQSNE